MSRAGSIKQVSLALNGVPDYQGTIAATTSGISNLTTGVAFTLQLGPGAGHGVYLEVDADVFVSFTGGASPANPATTAAMKIASGTGLYLVLKEDRNIIMARTATGTANVKVFKVS